MNLFQKLLSLKYRLRYDAMTLNALNYQKCAVLHKILDNVPIEKLNSFLVNSTVTMFIEIHCIKCIFLQFNNF